QPLLKGFGKKINRTNIFLARLTSETTLHEIENMAINLIYNVESAYWNLVYARETLKVRENSLAQADSLLVYNRKGLELGILTESDVLEAESALLTRKQEMLDQRNQIKGYEDNLRWFLNLTSRDEWEQRLVPTDSPDISTIEFDIDSALAQALNLRPDYKIARKTLEQNELNLAVAKNNKYPSLNLAAQYRLNGSGTTYSKDIRDMSELDQYGWRVGLTLSYPLKNRSAEADYEKKQIDVRRTLLTIEDIEHQIKTEIRTAIRNIRFLRERIDDAALSVEVNELKLRKEEERFRNQLSTSYYVLEFQGDLTNARNIYNKALIDYTVAIIELQRVSGTLLKELNIMIIPREN
ncbi:TolC family protein, partial [Candidatus Latescibacterota bacterium]